MFSRRKNTEPVQIIEAAPYAALAGIYDLVMNHVDYEHWARHLLRLARLHGLAPRRVLDLSCGTGRLCREFALRGCEVLACDASLPMLRVAAQHATAALQIQFWCASMERIALKGPVDLVVSSYDSMNYLHAPGQWHTTLLQAYRVLRPGGLFIFDVSTLRNSTEVFADYINEEHFTAGYYRRESRFEPETSLQYNYFEIELSSRPGCLYKEVHTQKIRSLDEIEQFITASPFIHCGHYANFSLRPGSEKADRVHFVLQKRPDNSTAQEH